MRGSVTITLDGNLITADQADVNTVTGEMKLFGNVQVRRRGLSAEQQAVMAVDKEYRLAQVNHDLEALDRILHPAFDGMNQNGWGSR